ncbi:MAG: hypothetical protein RL329_3397 [Bacteroidota bacterium]
MKNNLLFFFGLQTICLFGQVDTKAQLVGGWRIDPVNSCFSSNNLELETETRVYFYENGLVRSDFLPDGRWELKGDFLWIRPASSETPVDIFHIRADWNQGIFVIDASAVNDARAMQPIRSSKGTCQHTFIRQEVALNEVKRAIPDSTFFNFWHGYGGSSRDELIKQARAQPKLYQDICETPFKYVPSGHFSVYQKIVGIWYTADFKSRKILLTKTHPQSESQGMKVIRFYAENEYAIEDFTFDFFSRITYPVGEWNINYDYNALILNHFNWKPTFLPNGDLLLERGKRYVEDDD